MASSYQAFKDLDLSRDEVERIGNALKDKEFRKLFAEYVEEIQDPENRKIYQREITELEKERGIDVTFINPVAGYVIKTSADGNKKCFINVCANEHVKKPSSSPAVQEGSRGLQWSLPHSLSPVREDIDNKKVRCDVYDVVFHPDTLHLAQNNKAFRDMVNNTACEAIESNFDVKLDKKNLKFPKLQYKGMQHATVIRKPSKDKPVEREPQEQELFDKLYSSASESKVKPKKKKSPKKTNPEDSSLTHTQPNYIIKHRSHIDMQECVEHKDAKMNTAIPKELVVEIDLPLLKSASDITLDVTERSLQLLSEKPAKYKLDLTLPYHVNQDCGNAKFDKDFRKLIVTLPVKRNETWLISEDSGVDSDHGSPISTSPSSTETALVSEISATENVIPFKTDFRTNLAAFLDSNLQYSLPDFTCHVFQNNLAFTLNVKNVSENSIEKTLDESTVHVKFVSVSPSFFPVHYAFYVKLPDHSVVEESVTVEAWDNNVVLQFCFSPSDKIVEYCLFGINENALSTKYIEEPCILNSILKENEVIEHNNEESKQESIELKQEAEFQQQIVENKKEESRAIDIVGAYSESSGDELSYSYSPSKGKGILKRLGKRMVGRSISESSLEDVICASSFDNCHTSLDSVIPEDGEVSTSLKKTVRFNDNVSRQLYRSNSSILGQKKKNQRKARNKKRAHERRCSESENSEAEEKRERDEETRTPGDMKCAEFTDRNGDSDDFPTDVFDLDMYQ